MKRDNAGKFRPTHGLSRHRVYNIHKMMLDRCYNPKADSYARYGGRGIQVCERWHSFEMFVADMGLPPTSRHQLDRIDNDGNYCPENCQWVTRKQQQNNREVCHTLTFRGRTQTITEWAEELGVDRGALYYRANNGWSTEKTLTKPIKGKELHHAIF